MTAPRPTLPNVLASEWLKLRTLRSTWYTVLATLVASVGFSALLSFAAARRYLTEAPAERLSFDPTSSSLSGLFLAQLAVGVLGALVFTGEYATGSIRASLAAVPGRRRLLAAKAAVLAALALGLGELVGFASFLCGQTMLAGHGVPSASLNQPGVPRAVLGSGLYLAGVGLIGVALGALLRATAGAVAVIVAGAVLVPAFTPALPDAWADAVMRYWPTQAGQRLMTVHRDPHLLGPWSGYAVMLGAVAVLLAAAVTLLKRRDA